MLALRLWFRATVVALAVLFTLDLLMPFSSIMYLYRMHMYPHQHPVQYAILIGGVFAVVATTWAHWFGGSTGWKRHGGILVSLLLTLLCLTPLAGLLWVVHDIHHGFWPGWDRALANLKWGVMTAFGTALLIIALSYSLNVVSIAVAHKIMDESGRAASARDTKAYLRYAMRRATRDILIVCLILSLPILLFAFLSSKTSLQERLQFFGSFAAYGIASYTAGVLVLLVIILAEEYLRRKLPAPDRHRAAAPGRGNHSP